LIENGKHGISKGSPEFLRAPDDVAGESLSHRSE